MTRRTVVLTFCDMPHDDEVEAATYTIDGPVRSVEVDLCGMHAQEVDEWLRVGRPVRASTTRKPARVRVRT